MNGIKLGDSTPPAARTATISGTDAPAIPTAAIPTARWRRRISTTGRRRIHLTRRIIEGFGVVADVAVGIHARRVAQSFIRREEDAGDGIVVARDVIVQPRCGVIVLAGEALVRVLAEAVAVLLQARAWDTKL